MTHRRAQGHDSPGCKATLRQQQVERTVRIGFVLESLAEGLSWWISRLVESCTISRNNGEHAILVYSNVDKHEIGRE